MPVCGSFSYRLFSFSKEEISDTLLREKML